MKVKTVKKHGNAYPPQYIKNIGRNYEVEELDGLNLIASGLVVANMIAADLIVSDENDD